MPVYEIDIENELRRRNYRPAVIHHYIPIPPDEHHHPPPELPPIHHHHAPIEAPDGGKAFVILALVLLGLTAYEEEE